MRTWMMKKVPGTFFAFFGKTPAKTRIPGKRFQEPFCPFRGRYGAWGLSGGASKITFTPRSPVRLRYSRSFSARTGCSITG